MIIVKLCEQCFVQAENNSKGGDNKTKEKTYSKKY